MPQTQTTRHAPLVHLTSMQTSATREGPFRPFPFRRLASGQRQPSVTRESADQIPNQFFARELRTKAQAQRSQTGNPSHTLTHTRHTDSASKPPPINHVVVVAAPSPFPIHSFSFSHHTNTCPPPPPHYPTRYYCNDFTARQKQVHDARPPFGQLATSLQQWLPATLLTCALIVVAITVSPSIHHQNIITRSLEAHLTLTDGQCVSD